MSSVLWKKAESMRLFSGLPEKFWAEAMSTAAYVANRSPSSGRGKLTPFEIRFNRKPVLHHLRVFGCRAWTHIPKATRSKLQPKAREAIFVGYSSSRKGYKFYDLARNEF